MSSLAHCIKKHGLHKIAADKLETDAVAYRAEGYSAVDANRGAVIDAIETLEAEKAGIIGQIKKQIP